MHRRCSTAILPFMQTEAICTRCKERQPFSFHVLECSHCSGPLDMAVDTVIPAPCPVSLGEGNTPVVPLPKIGGILGMERLFAKLEFLNPTGSFKDRGSAVLVSELKNQNIQRVAEDSSGNAGASIAAYCARASIEATIFAPASAPPMKLEQISFYGATIVKIEGGRGMVADACRQYCLDNNVVYASHNLSPLFIEGTKGFASEVALQMDPPPDHVLFPVGNGSLLIGAWKGYRELTTAKGRGRIPRLHCIQSKACMPLAAAYAKKTWTPPPDGVSTVAGGIAVERPPRLQQVLEALEDTKGRAVAVDEKAIIYWQRQLSNREGIFVEPTSAATLAGLSALLKDGHILPKDRVLIALTGFGFKDRIPGA